VLREERRRISSALGVLPSVEVFPSAANFLLIRLDSAKNNPDIVFSALLDRKILIKNVSKMHPLLKNCLRVTVSTPEENELFLDAFKASLAV
jgi:histidinol-phosphate aminotransferase